MTIEKKNDKETLPRESNEKPREQRQEQGLGRERSEERTGSRGTQEVARER